MNKREPLTPEPLKKRGICLFRLRQSLRLLVLELHAPGGSWACSTCKVTRVRGVLRSSNDVSTFFSSSRSIISTGLCVFKCDLLGLVELRGGRI